ncbi:FG-GAP repeat domain-containing protein, partial [Streptomyces sp. NPDC096319]|uniref:FG-GAP repeat domain-containing protein n=1 Tax=Streptomyces sp. NPDC096319 TaxID=3366084 RepID=UPI0037FCA5EB
MLFPHSTRARRGAGCTALALTAGMLLAAPASADGSAPHPVVPKPVTRVVPASPKLPGSGALGQGALADAGVGASPLLSDFDGDGAGDLIYRVWDGKVRTASTSTASAQFGSFPEPPKDVVPIGNQDGNASGPEVLTLSPLGTLSLWADATPSGGTLAWQGGGWGIYNKIVAPGDVNDDGRADLVARDHDGVLWLYYATGKRTAPFAARVLLGGGWNGYDQLFGIGDDNGDGWADLLGRDTSGTLWFYAGTGDKAKPFATRRSIGVGWGGYNQIFPVGDDDGDGNGELIARDLDGTLWYYTGKGDGTLAPRTQIGQRGEWDWVVQFGGAGNIPVGGEKDGVFARDTTGTMYWYGTTNGGRLGTRARYGNAGDWRGADFTHLSTMDPDASSDLAEVFQGVLYVDSVKIGSGWGVYNALVGPGDLSGDGKGDLLARDRSGVLYLYKGNG